MSNTTSDIGKGVRRGLAWEGVASGLIGALDILAYILILALGWVPKEDFGVAALAFTIFPVLDLAMNMGLTAAVIQRDDHTPEKVSTVFWLGLGFSLLLFLLLAFALGPLLSNMHKRPVLTDLLTLYGVKLLWQNIYLLPLALMTRELRFKETSLIRTCANIAEFGAKVGFAAAGFGVWCFVAGPLCRALVTGIGVQLRNPWRPRFVFRFQEARAWAAFGIKTSAHRILFHIYNTVDYQVVGYYFGDAALGIYTLAFKIVLEPAFIISEVTVRVAFPAFSKLRHDRDALFAQLVSFCRMNLVLMLAFIGLIFVGAEEILTLFSSHKGNDYAAGAPAIRILCGVAVLRALSFVIPPLLDGMGRPTLTLIYAIVASVTLSTLFVVFAVLFGESLGFYSVAIAWLVGYPVTFLVLLSLAFTLLERPKWQLFQKLAGITTCALAAGCMAAVAKLLSAEFPASIRFALITITMLGTFATLLARFQDISPRTIKAGLK
ncbi:MAG: oligosaccharide flippase family protein [Myxococcales bacterium]|nr:oligosaccharide flippase family protein [Myxococcales bacterium]